MSEQGRLVPKVRRASGQGYEEIFAFFAVGVQSRCRIEEDGPGYVLLRISDERKYT